MTDIHKLFADIGQWHEDHPWGSRWYRLKSRIKDIRHHLRAPHWYAQRARRGYSTRDMWSFDTYIAGVIGRACRDLRENGHGYPCDTTEDEWNDVLDRISGPLLAYEALKFDAATLAEGTARHEAAREAMHLFAQNLGGMWD